MSDNLRMIDILDGIVEEEATIKLANVENAYWEDQDRIDLFEEAIDFIKEASTTGELPELDASQAISLAVELVEDEMMEKEAEAWGEIGGICAELLEELGFDADELDKIASTEEGADDLGRLTARAYMTYVTGEDYIGLEEE